MSFYLKALQKYAYLAKQPTFFNRKCCFDGKKLQNASICTQSSFYGFQYRPCTKHLQQQSRPTDGEVCGSRCDAACKCPFADAAKKFGGKHHAKKQGGIDLLEVLCGQSCGQGEKSQFKCHHRDDAPQWNAPNEVVHDRRCKCCQKPCFPAELVSTSKNDKGKWGEDDAALWDEVEQLWQHCVGCDEGECPQVCLCLVVVECVKFCVGCHGNMC